MNDTQIKHAKQFYSDWAGRNVDGLSEQIVIKMLVDYANSQPSHYPAPETANVIQDLGGKLEESYAEIEKKDQIISSLKAQLDQSLIEIDELKATLASKTEETDSKIEEITPKTPKKGKQ